ncbi:MAG: hypothetical protein J6N81_00470 [Treponema sp.]|nr:hypothetical protein [Treponema sp.]
MEKQDSFERMATGISDEERQQILDKMHDSVTNDAAPLHPAEEKLDDTNEPFEIKIKNESVFLRFFIWIKSILSNTTQNAIYNEYKLYEICRNIEKNFPGIINSKNELFLSPFYDRLTELKSCAAFFKPYLTSIAEENEGMFYVFLSTIILPEVTADIETNVDPYSIPISPDIRPDLRSSLLRKLEEIFDSIPSDDKSRMYEAAKASEWLRQFVRLPFARFLAQFTSSNENGFTCQFNQVESEVDSFARILCSSLSIPDEFLESLYLFAVRNAKHVSEEENGRDAGDFLGKAHSSLGLLQMFMSSVPIRSIGCIVHRDYQWKTALYSAGEDWFVKYKNAWKRIFDQKWTAWEADCKREALLSRLKLHFDIDFFPKFPESPWEDLWDGGVRFTYEATLGFLNWFMREKFSICELDLKTLLVQGSFNKKENHDTLSESFNNMIQLSISFQELTRRLSIHGETGAMFNKIHEDKSRTLQAQSKVDQMMRSLESDVSTLIHRFGDSARSILKILYGVLGLSKDTRFDTVKNLNSMKDKNNEPFVKKIELSKNLIENALNIVIELESLDKQRAK